MSSTETVTTGSDSAQKETPETPEYFTYERTGPSARRRAFEEAAMEECRSARRAQRERTHGKIAKIPGSAMFSLAALTALIGTFAFGSVWGASSAVTFQMGAAMATAYVVVNDVRISIAEKNPSWRRRHKVLAFFFRQHPLDDD